VDAPEGGRTPLDRLPFFVEHWCQIEVMKVTSSPLLGLAIGDALGMPFETAPAEDPALLAWRGEFRASAYHGLSPGQWTDDTMMSKLLAESLLAHDGYDPRATSELYVEWLQSGDLRGMGKSTKIALTRLSEGCHWGDSGVKGAEGNGSAMRAAPLGLLFRDRHDLLIEAACVDAQITHRSKEAEEGSIAVALAVSYLANGIARQDLIQEVTKYLTESEVKRGLLKADFYARTGGLGVAEALRLIGTSARVTHTVPAAMAAFLLTKSYKEAILAAIRAGGDTDTTAAVTGALAGAYYGREAILQTDLHTQLEKWEELAQLDDELYRKSFFLAAPTAEINLLNELKLAAI
jgi:ADP-ribosylglycohydrolase